MMLPRLYQLYSHQKMVAHRKWQDHSLLQDRWIWCGICNKFNNDNYLTCLHDELEGPFKIWFSHNAFYPAARNRICKARDARVQTSNCCRERHPHWPTGRQGEKHHALTLHNTNTFLLSIFFLLLLFSSHFSLQVIRPHLCQSQMKAASNTAPGSPFVKPSMLSVDFFERGEVRRKEKKRRERKKGEAQSSKLSLFIIIFLNSPLIYISAWSL